MMDQNTSILYIWKTIIHWENYSAKNKVLLKIHLNEIHGAYLFFSVYESMNKYYYQNVTRFSINPVPIFYFYRLKCLITIEGTRKSYYSDVTQFCKFPLELCTRYYTMTYC